LIVYQDIILQVEVHIAHPANQEHIVEYRVVHVQFVLQALIRKLQQPTVLCVKLVDMQVI
jgi:hypothetical protein